MDFLLTFGLFALVAGGFAWLIWRGAQTAKRQKADLAALAQRNGWQVAEGREGRRTVTTVTGPDGAWTLRLLPSYSTGSKSTRRSHPGSSEFRAAEPVWDGGRAVFAPRLPGAVERLQGGVGLTGFLQSAAMRTLLSRIVPPEVLDDLPNLRQWDAPAGVELTILATEDPRGADLPRIHDAIHGWTPVHARDRAPPAVMIGAEGFRMRLPACLHEAEDIAAFAERAQALAQALR